MITSQFVLARVSEVEFKCLRTIADKLISFSCLPLIMTINYNALPSSHNTFNHNHEPSSTR